MAHFNTKSKTHLIATSLLISSLAFLPGCNKADAVNTTDTEKEIIAIPVEAVTVSLGDISSQYSSTTVLEAKVEAEVVSKAAGIIENIYVEEGEYVKEGQLLAEIEPDRFKLNLAKARSELASVKHELERINKVHAKKMVSTDTFDKLKWEYESLKSVVAIAELDLKETKIIAPISGYIAKRYVKEGNMVEQFARQKLFHIVQQDTLQALVNLPEQELAKLHIDQKATLALTALPNKQVEAKVSRISPIVDANTGTFRVTLEVANPEQRLKAGMFAQVELNYDTHTDTTLIPKRAVISMDNKHVVYLIQEKEGKHFAHKTELEVGYDNQDFVEVLKGLEDGQQVVMVGQHNLKDQSLVEVVNQD